MAISDATRRYFEAVKIGVCRRKRLQSDSLETPLRRCLTSLELTLYGVSSMIGASLFVVTGSVVRKKTGPAAFLAYALAGCVAILNAMSYAEMSCRFPKAGSAYTYSYIALGELIGFLTGWAVILEYVIGTASVARSFGSTLNTMLHGSIRNWTDIHIGRLSPPNSFLAEDVDLVGTAIIILLSIFVCLGVRSNSIANSIFSFFGMLVISVLTVFLLTRANVGYFSPPSHGGFLPFGAAGLLAGTGTCFYAFIGFDMVSTCAEEALNPRRSLPVANILSVFIVTVMMTMGSLALILYVPWWEVDIESPFLIAFKQRGVTSMFYFSGVGILVVTGACILTGIVAAPRIVYSMAQDGLLFKGLSCVCQPFKTPVWATVFIALPSMLLTMIFDINSLADFLSLGTLIAYSMVSIAVVILRYDPTVDHEPHKSDDVTKDSLNEKENIGRLSPSLRQFLLFEKLNSAPPGRVVRVCMVLFLIISTALVILIVVGSSLAIIGTWWSIILITVLLLLDTVCVLLMSAHTQRTLTDLFQVPLSPMLPCLTIFINLLIIANLPVFTWVRFSTWIVIGIILYFTYGVSHSALVKLDNEASPLITMKSQSALPEDDSVDSGKPTQTNEDSDSLKRD